MPRFFRLLLPLIMLFTLTACDAPLLPPDARLPDGSTYSGDLKNGLFHGEGVQHFPNGEVYTGEFREGYWHGQGEFDSPAGWHYAGEFHQGQMSGQGVLEDDRGRYEGGFRGGLFHGEGRYEVNGEVYQAEFAAGEPVQGRHITDYGTYEGAFQDWYYHGDGVFYPQATAGFDALSGRWEYGEFVGDEGLTAGAVEQADVQQAPLLTEQVLAEDRQRLAAQVEALAPQRPGVTDVYFLAVGGDGTESVFMRDIKVARAGLQARFDIDNRTIQLLNHRDYGQFPLATRPSIARALAALDQHMNPEEDLLVVHLVSHGGEQGQLLLQQPGIELPDLTPEDFAAMLEPLQAHRRLLVVSACFSGHWIDTFNDRNTLIMTSARSDRTSFGCGDDSEMTWFTKAVYRNVGLSLDDPEAMFRQIDAQIRSWEEEFGMEEGDWSYPQFHLGDDLRQWLSQRPLRTGG